jgi:excisionase family DNA binding protein
MVEKRGFSIGEAAVMLAVAKSTIRYAIARGEISSLRVGRRILIPAAALERLLQERGGASVGVAR